MQKLKKGDRVRCVSGSYPITKIGTEWTFLEYQYGGPFSDYIVIQGEDNCVYTVEADDFVKVGKKEVVEVKPDPKALDNVVMPEEKKIAIKSVLSQKEKEKMLFEKWGLGETIKYGKGMTMLFWGPPGTGKTWSAECIAKYLGKKLKTLDSGTIFSSEPGQAERTIKSVFEQAKKDNSILFLDEADSLIGSRTSLGMILGSIVNTLLTEIERFDGVLILSTNRIDTLDEALERRISLILEFKEPTVDERAQIWEKLLPKSFPMDGISIDELSAEKLTGGQIKNAILSAARLAAHSGDSKVRKEHFQSAITNLHAGRGRMGTSTNVVQDFDVKMR